MGEASELDRAKEAAYRLLAYRPRSISEMRGRLREKGFDEETISSAIERLREMRFLDDGELAARMARDLVNLKGYGRFQVEMRLGAKGIEKALARSAVDAVFADVDEREAARRIARKKMGGRPADLKEKGRLGRYLHGRGYSWDIITEVLRELDERERD